MRTIILGMALFSTPALAVERFDLVCEGRFQSRVNAKWEATRQNYRIDLENGAWCGAECETIEKIKRIEPGKLILDESDPSDRSRPLVLHEIDRVTGALVHRIIGSGLWLITESECQKSSFSGFPKPKF